MRRLVAVLGFVAIASTSGAGPVLTPVAGRPEVIAIVAAGDGSNRLFLAEAPGLVTILAGAGLLAEPFLDIRTLVSHPSPFSERGLLGLAFHPRYRDNRTFFVSYTDLEGAVTVARYRTTDDPDRADPGSGEVLLAIPHAEAAIHNGGQLAFGPDGYLYVGVGDGNDGGDAAGNAQSTETLLGKILRIDVDGATPYAIPPDNPFAGGGGRPEIWATGLRNPWRFSFDRATGDLWIPDVGQDRWEEVSLAPAGTAGGANYGWNRLEGRHCFGTTSCDATGTVLPVLEYDHDEGCSVIGGYRYRGQHVPGLDGTYVFSDFCSCRLYVAREVAGAWTKGTLADAPCWVSTMGEDEQGELYLASLTDGVYRVDAGTPALVATASMPREGALGLTPMTITLRRLPATEAATYTVRTTARGSATPHVDFVPVSRTVTLAAGQGFADVEVPVRGDGDVEPDETVVVGVVDAAGARTLATGIILNDDLGPPLVSVGDAVVSEDGGAARFVATLSWPSASTTSVRAVTEDRTARAGVDYVASAVTVTFPPGETQRTIDVALLDDAGDEFDETFGVVLSRPLRVRLARLRATGSIVDDDPPPPDSPAVSVADASVVEGGRRGAAVLGFLVTLSAPSARPITVRFETRPGGTATPGADYVATASSVTFAPGQTSRRVPVAVRGDGVPEDGETVLVGVTGATNAVLGDVDAVGTIVDDDR